MSKREWWPCAWADEVMPPGRAEPNDFLIDAEGHYFLGYPLDAKDVQEHEKRTFSRSLHVNDIVPFVCSEGLGQIDVTFNPDGSFVVKGDVPERATHFSIPGDVDTLASSVREFVENYLELEPISEPHTETLAMAWWSDDLPHKLTITYGPHLKTTASFVAVSQAEAKQ